MEQKNTISLVSEIMLDYVSMTGLDPVRSKPERYLWTDAFALCNLLELFRHTVDVSWLDLALRLVHQVHHTLGRQRADAPKSGWISGLGEKEGERHPTRGGLRIGKKLNERDAGQAFDEQLEWERDGQYFHYLTKWMHALNRTARVSGQPEHCEWALELARAAHNAFSYAPSAGGVKRMYWKMSIDLSRPLVPSMGQHDPLDGYLTFCELHASAHDLSLTDAPDLKAEIAEMATLCRGKEWATDDPLGIGGLLCDAWRMAQLMDRDAFRDTHLLERVVVAALIGLETFAGHNPLDDSAAYRLAFRELGLAIGLKAVAPLREWCDRHPEHFAANSPLRQWIDKLMTHVALAGDIEDFWLSGKNRESKSWREHRGINMVMLATSLGPEGFLTI